MRDFTLEPSSLIGGLKRYPHVSVECINNCSKSLQRMQRPCIDITPLIPRKRKSLKVRFGVVRPVPTKDLVVPVAIVA